MGNNMNIVIVHLGNISQLLPSTSVVNGIKKKEKNTHITWVVGNKDFCCINQYNKNIDRTINIEQFIKEEKVYDLLINLYLYFPENIKINSIIKNLAGIGFNPHFDQFKDVLSGENCINMTILQLYFMLSGLTWKGEGYDIGYYPKTKTNKNRIGVSVANANIRNYVLDNLELEGKKIWYVPYKKNIFKKIDEINKCKKIITDDLTTFHLAMLLRKYVYYLETFPLSTKLEMFGNGEMFKVPMNIF
jgi:hypothetical protein